MVVDAQRRDGLGLGDDPDLLVASAGQLDDTVAIERPLVAGQPIGEDFSVSEGDCEHDLEFVNETVIAVVREDSTGGIARWEVRVRVQCAGCGVKFSIQHQGRGPRDGGPGVVHVMHPITD